MCVYVGWRAAVREGGVVVPAGGEKDIKDCLSARPCFLRALQASPPHRWHLDKQARGRDPTLYLIPTAATRLRALATAAPTSNHTLPATRRPGAGPRLHRQTHGAMMCTTAVISYLRPHDDVEVGDIRGGRRVRGSLRRPLLVADGVLDVHAGAVLVALEAAVVLLVLDLAQLQKRGP